MALSHSPRSDCKIDQIAHISCYQSVWKHIQQNTAGSLTGIYSGSHSGMFRLLISMEIFLRWPGLVTPMAVRSCRHNKTTDISEIKHQQIRKEYLYLCFTSRYISLILTYK